MSDTTGITTYEYKIITAFTPQRLELVVQEHMSAGWQLSGGVAFFEQLAEPWTQTTYRICKNSSLLQS